MKTNQRLWGSTNPPTKEEKKQVEFYLDLGKNDGGRERERETTKEKRDGEVWVTVSRKVYN